MGTRAEELASRFEQASNELIEVIEQCSEDQWRAMCEGEGWRVGVTAHHIAAGTMPIAGAVQALASGQTLPGMSMEQIHKGNEEHARQHVDCTKEETLELLRRDVAPAAGIVRGLSDEQLDTTAKLFAEIPPMSAQQMIENVLIHHAAGHLESIRAAL